MSRARRFAVLALPTALLLVPPSRPVRADAPSASALQSQLRDWISGLSQGKLPSDKVPVDVAQSGQTYTVTVPVPPSILKVNSAGDFAGLQAVLHPLDGGLWSLDSARWPADSTFTFQPPPPSNQGGGLSDQPAQTSKPVTLHMTLGAQEEHGTLDPALANAKTVISGTGKALAITATGNFDDAQPDKTVDGLVLHIDSMSNDTSLAPVAGAALDVDQGADIKGINAVINTPKGTATVVVDHVQADSHIGALNKASVGTVYGLYAQLVLATANMDKGQGMPMGQMMEKETLRGLVGALANLATDMRRDTAIDGIKFIGPDGKTLTADHAALGYGGVVKDDGLLTAYLDIGLEGLSVPQAPANVRPFLPTHLKLHPVLSGISTADLLKLSQAGLEDDPQQKQGELMAGVFSLFSHGGIKLGFDGTEVTLGATKLTASGSIVAAAPAPQAIKAGGKITAENFDALLTQVQADPEQAQLAQMLTSAKTLAKQDGNQLVWVFSYKAGGLQVNGQDVIKRPGAPQQ